MLLGDRRHVGDRGRRRAQPEADEAGRGDGGIVASAEGEVERIAGEQEGQQALRGENRQHGQREVGERPDLHAHQRHREEDAERHLGDQRHRGRPPRPGEARRDDRQQVRQDQPAEQAGDEERQGESGARQPGLDRHAGDHADVDGQDRAQEGVGVDALALAGELDADRELLRRASTRAGTASAAPCATGPPSRLARIRPSVAQATPISSAFAMPRSLGEDRRPGDRRAVAADLRHAAGDQADGRGQPDQARHRDAHQVLDHDEGDGGDQQHEQRPAADLEVGEAGVHADGREEVDEQDVARGELEGDRHARREVDQRDHRRAEQPADHRLRDVPVAQDPEARRDRPPQKEGEDPDRHRDEGTDRDAGLGPVHGPSPSAGVDGVERQADEDGGDDRHHARTQEAVVQEVLADLRRAGRVEGDRGEQRAVGRQEEDGVGRRVEGDQHRRRETEREADREQDRHRGRRAEQHRREHEQPHRERPGVALHQVRDARDDLRAVALEEGGAEPGDADDAEDGADAAAHHRPLEGLRRRRLEREHGDPGDGEHDDHDRRRHVDLVGLDSRGPGDFVDGPEVREDPDQHHDHDAGQKEQGRPAGIEQLPPGERRQRLRGLRRRRSRAAPGTPGPRRAACRGRRPRGRRAGRRRASRAPSPPGASGSEMSWPPSRPTTATVAAEIGEATTPSRPATTLIESGRSGRMPALRETSAITGSRA